MLELDQIAIISVSVDDTVAMVTRDGFMACSCGWSDSVAGLNSSADKLHEWMLKDMMKAS